MMIENITRELESIFRDVFDDESIELNRETCSENIDEWDSLMHITLLAAIQDEFSIQFNIDEITSMKKVGDMIDAIEGKL